MTPKKDNPVGLRPRHRSGCPAQAGGDCKCSPGWEAWAYHARHGRKIRRTFPTKAAAKAWRADAVVDVRKGRLAPPTPMTVQMAWDEWYAGACSGLIRPRKGAAFKPSTLRGYRAAMETVVLPEFGSVRLSSLSHLDLQDFADSLLAKGASPSTVRNTLMPLRPIFRRACKRGDVVVNPTGGLEMPAVELTRRSDVTKDDVVKLLAALPDDHRALWAMAFYGGLRLGEIQALDWSAVDLDAKTVKVERGWDGVAREFIVPKSKAGTRVVPLTQRLRTLLAEHRLRTGRSTGLVFGADGVKPFVGSTVSRRAKNAWEEAGLPVTSIHVARHAAVSFLIDTGLNVKEISTYIGHASVATTLDRYGHLLRGSEAAAADRLDTYFEDDLAAS